MQGDRRKYVQLYLVLFALTTSERGGCCPRDNTRDKTSEIFSRHCGLTEFKMNSLFVLPGPGSRWPGVTWPLTSTRPISDPCCLYHVHGSPLEFLLLSADHQECQIFSLHFIHCNRAENPELLFFFFNYFPQNVHLLSVLMFLVMCSVCAEKHDPVSSSFCTITLADRINGNRVSSSANSRVRAGGSLIIQSYLWFPRI